MSSEDPAPDGHDDAVEQLVLRCLEVEGASPFAALERVCDEHPDHAAELRARLALINDYDLLNVATGEPPRRFGDFTLIRKLGEGGFGIVHLARQESLGRRVVLKLLRPGIANMSDARVRFEREIQATARLEHAGICPLLEAGEVEGIPYLAMQYVPGEALEDRLRRVRRRGAFLDLDEVLAWGGQLARALHAAHEAGLVHRDIKPGNVLIDRDARALLLDFGLARLLDDESLNITRTGEVIGTPAYMSPEQVLGDPVDQRTDVYALGVLLYECLTMRCPFEAVSRRELEQAILTSRYRDVREIRRAVPRDISIVVATAMERSEDRRYATALDLAEDLSRAGRGEPILARPAGAWLRARRWCRRNAIAVVVLASLTVGVVVTGALLWQVRSSLQRAEDLALAGLARDVAVTDPVAGIVIARQAVARTQHPATLSALYHCLAASHEQGLFRHRAEVWRAVFSADGDYVASCSDDQTARIWDVLHQREVKALLHGGQVMDIDTHGNRIVTAAMDGTARLWRFDGEPLGKAPLPDRTGLANRCLRARFSHSGEKVLITSFGGLAWLWDIAQDKVTELPGHDGMVWHVCFSPRDRFALTAVGYGSEVRPYGKDLTPRIWDSDGKEVARLEGHTKPLMDADFSPDGTFVLTSSQDQSVRLWKTTGELVRVYRMHSAAVRCVRFHRGGELFASGGLDGSVRIAKLDGRVVDTFDHDGAVWSLEFSRDGERLLTASWDKTVRIHDLRGRLLRTLRGHADYVMHATFSPDGKRVASASWDHTVRLWRADDRAFGVHVGHAKRVRTIAFARSGVFATGSSDGAVILWTPTERQKLPMGFRVNRLAFSPDDRSVAAAMDDQTIAIWPSRGGDRSVFLVTTESFVPGMPPWRSATVAFLDEGRLLVGAQDGEIRLLDIGRATLSLIPESQENRRNENPKREILDVAPHPDGRHFAAARWLGEVTVHDLAGNVLDRVAHDARVVRVEFSPNGDLLMTASRDGLVKLWKWTEGRLEQHPIVLAHEPAVTWACFAPDGSRVLTTAMDGRARIWSVAGDEMLVIQAGPDALWSGAWSPDGKRIVTGADNGIVRSWPVDTREILTLAKARASRGLAPETAARVERVGR